MGISKCWDIVAHGHVRGICMLLCNGLSLRSFRKASAGPEKPLCKPNFLPRFRLYFHALPCYSSTPSGEWCRSADIRHLGWLLVLVKHKAILSVVRIFKPFSTQSDKAFVDVLVISRDSLMLVVVMILLNHE